MLPAPFTEALVLTGPTASGKTRLGVDLAVRLDAEIVSMDSMALYRRMDIGTAKPTAEERRAVPHHLVDVLEPTESASVAWWLEQATRLCQEIESRGKQTLFVGGTPLYLKTLLFGLFAGPGADLNLRGRLEHDAQLHGSAALHERLAAVDPTAAARIHPNDLRRIIRALEVFERTGQTISQWQQQWPVSQAGAASPPPAPNPNLALTPSGTVPLSASSLVSLASSAPSILWLDWPRDIVYARINRRVEEMFERGLVDEAAALRQLGRPLSKEACQAVGYAEVFDHLDGLCTRQQAIERVQIRTRQFAKRQITWFRHLPGCLPATSELTGKLWQPKMRERGG